VDAAGLRDVEARLAHLAGVTVLWVLTQKGCSDATSESGLPETRAAREQELLWETTRLEGTAEHGGGVALADHVAESLGPVGLGER
jgi:hypothetical protein